MALGTCDPASRGGTLNTTETAEGGGAILITIRWGWDAVSTRDTAGGCNGPIEDIRVRNISQTTYYAQLPMKRRGNKWLEIPPGTDQTYSGGQLRSAGLDNYADVNGVRLSPDPALLL